MMMTMTTTTAQRLDPGFGAPGGDGGAGSRRSGAWRPHGGGATLDDTGEPRRAVVSSVGEPRHAVLSSAEERMVNGKHELVGMGRADTKDIYHGTFETEEEATEAYDIAAAIELCGVHVVTNFDISEYGLIKLEGPSEVAKMEVPSEARKLAGRYLL